MFDDYCHSTLVWCEYIHTCILYLRINIHKYTGAVGHFRLQATCRVFNALALKLDSVVLLQDCIPSLLVARNAHHLVLGLEEMSSWVVW